MDDYEGITAADVRAWEQKDVTKMFFDKVKELKNNADVGVHSHLRNGEFNNAIGCDGGLVIINEILEIPDELAEELKEGNEDGN